MGEFVSERALLVHLWDGGGHRLLLMLLQLLGMLIKSGRDEGVVVSGVEIVTFADVLVREIDLRDYRFVFGRDIRRVLLR